MGNVNFGVLEHGITQQASLLFETMDGANYFKNKYNNARVYSCMNYNDETVKEHDDTLYMCVIGNNIPLHMYLDNELQLQHPNLKMYNTYKTLKDMKYFLRRLNQTLSLSRSKI